MFLKVGLFSYCKNTHLFHINDHMSRRDESRVLKTCSQGREDELPPPLQAGAEGEAGGGHGGRDGRRGRERASWGLAQDTQVLRELDRGRAGRVLRRRGDQALQDTLLQVEQRRFGILLYTTMYRQSKHLEDFPTYKLFYYYGIVFSKGL